MMYVDEEVIEGRESDQPMPFERLEQEEAMGFLLRIVGTLPLRQQEVIQLKFQNDLSYQQIAEIMGSVSLRPAKKIQIKEVKRKRYG